MRHADGSFPGALGTSIYYQYWSPEGESKAVILVAHGAAEHGGRYNIFAEYFTSVGYTVVAIDHYGHGKSEGRRCCLRHFDDYVDDLNTLQGRLARDFPDLPQVLLGHSMGGLIACNYLLEQQDRFAACVLTGPAIKTDLVPPRWQMLLLKLIARIAPDLGVIQLDASGVSRDPREVDRYVNDPLNHTGKMTARMVVELFRGMETVQARAADIHLPLLLLHGGEDRMASPAGSLFLHDNVASTDMKMKIYPGLYHEIFNEPERLQVFADIEKWLDEH